MLSNILASFCVEAVEEAMSRYGRPELMSADQAWQYAGIGWIAALTKAEIEISIDWRG